MLPNLNTVSIAEWLVGQSIEVEYVRAEVASKKIIEWNQTKIEKRKLTQTRLTLPI